MSASWNRSPELTSPTVVDHTLLGSIPARSLYPALSFWLWRPSKWDGVAVRRRSDEEDGDCGDEWLKARVRHGPRELRSSSRDRSIGLNAGRGIGRLVERWPRDQSRAFPRASPGRFKPKAQPTNLFLFNQDLILAHPVSSNPLLANIINHYSKYKYQTENSIHPTSRTPTTSYVTRMNKRNCTTHSINVSSTLILT